MDIKDLPDLALGRVLPFLARRVPPVMGTHSNTSRHSGRTPKETSRRSLLVAFLSITLSLPAAAQRLPSTTPSASKVADESAARKTEDWNEKVIRRAFESFNRRDLNAYLDYYDLNAKNFGVAMGREGIRRGVEDVLATFPDWHMEIIDLIAHGDSVVARFTVSGTHRGLGKLPMNGGMLMGVEPTGKHFSVEHIHWFKLRDGKIVEHTGTRNDIGMMRQLGLLPPTGLPK